MGNERQIIAQRAALEIKDSMVVNLGIGIPSLVPNFLEAGKRVFFQAENGILGMGPSPNANPDGDLCNAAGYPVTLLSGGSYFDSATSFGMIRRGYIDLSILGALQVSQTGDLANWIVPGKRVPGVGGAMELAFGAKNLIALMTHCGKHGEPKILKKCTMPLTASNCVKKIITEMAVFSIESDGLYLKEIMAGYTLTDIKNNTEADCATLVTHQGKGYMLKLLWKLKEILLEKEIYCLYSLSRATSFGMNKAFYNLGFTYGGRLINNCFIYSGLEDMNVWYLFQNKKFPYWASK